MFVCMGFFPYVSSAEQFQQVRVHVLNITAMYSLTVYLSIAEFGAGQII